MCAVQAEVMFCQWKVWSRTDNLFCINIKEANMTRGKTSMLQTKRALSENGTKDLDTLSELRRSMPWVCLHTPNPHTWWELWGLVEMFPLAAGAEIIGPRFSQTFWYSHLEPSFDLHSSDQTAPVQTGSPDNVTYFDSFFCMWGIQTHFRLGFFFFSQALQVWIMMFMVNPRCPAITNICPATAGTAALVLSGVWIDLSGCQDMFAFCICLEVEGRSYRNDDLQDDRSLLGHPSSHRISWDVRAVTAALQGDSGVTRVSPEPPF